MRTAATCHSDKALSSDYQGLSHLQYMGKRARKNKIFRTVPLALLLLEITRGYVIQTGIAEYMRGGIFWLYILDAVFNHNRQFCLIINTFGHWGINYLFFRTYNCARRLYEKA